MYPLAPSYLITDAQHLDDLDSIRSQCIPVQWHAFAADEVQDVGAYGEEKGYHEAVKSLLQPSLLARAHHFIRGVITFTWSVKSETGK